MAKEKSKSSGYDYVILVPVILLIGIGLVMVYSASSHLAAHRFGDSYFYLKRQTLFCLFGIALMIAAKNIPCRVYSKLVYPLLLISCCLLILLLTSGLGYKVGGATRWLRLAGFSFQPSEFAKFALAVYMAYSISKKGSEMGSFLKGLLPHLLVAGTFMLLLVLQPDLGTAVIIGCWLFLLLFVGGVKVLHLFLMPLLSAPILIWLMWQQDYRIKRWWTFINPWDDPKGAGFQITHSFLSFGSGGIFGAGLGNSKQKLFYLPEAHTDFVLSIAAEELGFLGVTCIMALFGLLIAQGIRVALSARDLYSSYLALGLTCWIGLQVLVNSAVVVGLLPTKGLTLPLISYGGSSLVITLLGIGVLLNISSRT
ncbi:MAG TPA: putative lipid II flippase FtsW [Acidobacteriota bacterium]|nr:putative lipid II flippase FtsW [Acidobacteriota bacterium]